MNSAPPLGGLDARQREGIDWIVRLRSPDFTPQERAELACWRAESPANEAAYQDATALGALLRDVGQGILRDRQGATNVVPLRRPIVTTRRAVLAGSMAASVAAVLAIGRQADLLPAFGGPSPDYATATGERRTVVLARGLKIELDARTSIAVSKASPRQVELIDGRAEIEVRSDAGRPMTLVSAGGMVTGRDARFDVELIDGRTCVTCLEGMVAVSRGGERAMLQASRQIVYTDALFGQPELVDPAAASAWKSGQLIFDRTPLSEVVRQVNRYRHGRVVIANAAIGRVPVNGVFYTDRIQDVAGQIRQVTGARVTHLPGDVVVLS